MRKYETEEISNKTIYICGGYFIVKTGYLPCERIYLFDVIEDMYDYESSVQMFRFTLREVKDGIMMQEAPAIIQAYFNGR